jgi:organic anion transporter 4A
MVINGVLNVSISSLEKRFDLKSTDTGIIVSSYDIASLLSLIPVTYFGGIGNKPRWLGFGIIIMGLGSFVFAIPHFTTGLYQYDTSGDLNVCGSTANTSAICSNTNPNLYKYKYVLILAQLMHGVGAAPLYTLGVTFLDENLKQKMSSVYLGK